MVKTPRPSRQIVAGSGVKTKLSNLCPEKSIRATLPVEKEEVTYVVAGVLEPLRNTEQVSPTTSMCR
jgi:hypothetical protein